MKTMFSHHVSSPWQLLLRGVIASILCTVVLVVIFALLISLFDFSAGVIHAVNQIIKVVSIGVGVFFAVYPGFERGLIRGALVGLVYMAAGVMVYALLTGQKIGPGGYLADILMGVAAGGLIGLLRARAA